MMHGDVINEGQFIYHPINELIFGGELFGNDSSGIFFPNDSPGSSGLEGLGLSDNSWGWAELG